MNDPHVADRLKGLLNCLKIILVTFASSRAALIEPSRFQSGPFLCAGRIPALWGHRVAAKLRT